MDVSDIEMKENIINSTPAGQDPVMYWYQVAQDAINTIKRSEKQKQDDKNELITLRRYKDSESARIQHELESQTLPTIRELMHRVVAGEFSMNVSIGLYPTESREGRSES